MTVISKGLVTAFESAQADADLIAGAHKACSRKMGLTDQLDRLAALSGAGQPSACSEQKASQFFRSVNKAAISAMAFYLRCNSLWSAFIYRWS